MAYTSQQDSTNTLRDGWRAAMVPGAHVAHLWPEIGKPWVKLHRCPMLAPSHLTEVGVVAGQGGKFAVTCLWCSMSCYAILCHVVGCHVGPTACTEPPGLSHCACSSSLLLSSGNAMANAGVCDASPSMSSKLHLWGPSGLVQLFVRVAHINPGPFTESGWFGLQRHEQGALSENFPHYRPPETGAWGLNTHIRHMCRSS